MSTLSKIYEDATNKILLQGANNPDRKNPDEKTYV